MAQSLYAPPSLCKLWFQHWSAKDRSRKRIQPIALHREVIGWYGYPGIVTLDDIGTYWHLLFALKWQCWIPLALPEGQRIIPTQTKKSFVLRSFTILRSSETMMLDKYHLKTLTNEATKLRFFPQSHLNLFMQPLVALHGEGHLRIFENLVHTWRQ